MKALGTTWHWVDSIVKCPDFHNSLGPDKIEESCCFESTEGRNHLTSVPAPKKTHPILRFAKIVFGLALVGLGFVGLFLPILQGILLMLVGLALLGTESRRARRLIEELKRRHPGPWQKAEAVKRRISGYVRSFRRHGRGRSE